MGQVPPINSLLLIGSGRVANHLKHYLAMLDFPPLQWSHHDSHEKLVELLKRSDRVALAISDDAIAPFTADYRELLSNRLVFHFSGSLYHPEIPSAHPLMTFADRLYEKSRYQQILFVTEKGRPSLSELLPELGNSSVAISSEQKPLYHALCVCGGNLATLLWAEVLKEFEHLKIPAGALRPYLEQILTNVLQDKERALSGPLQRGDIQTVRRNLDSLKGHRIKSIYQAFLEWFPAINWRLP